MLNQSCLLGGIGGAKRSAVLQLNLTWPLAQPSSEETDSGCSDGYNSDSSLSPGPDAPRSSSLPDEPLNSRTRQLLLDYFREIADGSRANRGSDPALATLRRVGGGVMEKYEVAFAGMLKKLDIKSPEHLKPVMSVASHMFDDKVTNWGRIVALISFGAFVARHLRSVHLESSIEILAENFTDFLMMNKRDWMVDHNEWEGFLEFFHVEDAESGIRKVLMTLAGVAGVGASLAYMMR